MKKFTHLFLIVLLLSAGAIYGQTYDLTVEIESCCDINIQDSTGWVYLYGNMTFARELAGTVIFEDVPAGYYTLLVDVKGFERWEQYGIHLNQDKTMNAVLTIPVYPPRHINVDPVSSMLTWDDPLMASVDEVFSGIQFPPSYWYANSNGAGWFRSNAGGSSGFPVPPHDGYYAVVNNDLAGEGNDGCCDSLARIMVNLRYRDHFYLHFDSYFTGDDGQTGTVFYSTDLGITWDTLYEMTPDTSWQQIDIDLSFLSGYSGYDNAAFLFLANDHGQSGSGWAVDNVLVEAGRFYPEKYMLYIGGKPVDDSIPADTNSFYIPDLEYGENYVVNFGAYACCRWAHQYFSFNSAFLPPCENFKAHFDENDLTLSASWTVPTLNDSVAKGLTRFNVYMDNEIAGTIPYGGQGIGDTITLNDIDFTSGEHELCVQANYDLTPYGFPGETGESLFACDSIDIVFTGLSQRVNDGPNIFVFPNPATGQLNIQSTEPIRQIELINYTGQTVLLKQMNDKEVTLNMNGLKPGIYIAQIKTEKGIEIKKIVLK